MAFRPATTGCTTQFVSGTIIVAQGLAFLCCVHNINRFTSHHAAAVVAYKKKSNLYVNNQTFLRCCCEFAGSLLSSIEVSIYMLDKATARLLPATADLLLMYSNQHTGCHTAQGSVVAYVAVSYERSCSQRGRGG